mgnify:CR=1 FL=1
MKELKLKLVELEYEKENNARTMINIKELIIIFLISISIIPVDFIRKCILKKLRGDIGV